MWSTENNAIEMDGTDIRGTATITNNTDATIRSDSTAIDEAAIAIKDTTGTLNITNAGTMTGPNGLLVDNSIITFTNTGTVNATVGEALLLKKMPSLILQILEPCPVLRASISMAQLPPSPIQAQ